MSMRSGRLVARAVLLLVEGLAVKGARGSGDAAQDGQSKKSGQKGFHDRSPRFCRSVCCESLLLACAIWWCVAAARRRNHSCVMDADQSCYRSIFLRAPTPQPDNFCMGQSGCNVPFMFALCYKPPMPPASSVVPASLLGASGEHRDLPRASRVTLREG